MCLLFFSFWQFDCFNRDGITMHSSLTSTTTTVTSSREVRLTRTRWLVDRTKPSYRTVGDRSSLTKQTKMATGLKSLTNRLTLQTTATLKIITALPNMVHPSPIDRSNQHIHYDRHCCHLDGRKAFQSRRKSYRLVCVNVCQFSLLLNSTLWIYNQVVIIMIWRLVAVVFLARKHVAMGRLLLHQFSSSSRRTSDGLRALRWTLFLFF